MIDPARSPAPGIVFYDALGMLVFSNPTAQAVLGPAAAGLAGQADAGAAPQTLYADGTPCPPEERPAARARRTGQAVRRVVLGLAATPERPAAWLLVDADPVRTGGGQVTQIVVSFVDITARYAAQQTRPWGEQEFLALVENAPDVIARYDRAFRHVYVNHAVEQATGRKAATLIGKSLRDMNIPAELLAFWEAKLAAVFAGGQEQVVEYQGYSPAGPRWYESRLTPEFAPDGTVEFVLNIARDITDRHAAKTALQESEARFRLMFAGNPLPMWLYDMQTLAFLEVNEAAITHYGYSRDEFLAMHITDIRPREDVPLLLDDIAQARADYQQSGYWRHRRKDGTILEVQITSHTMQTGDRPTVLVVAQNITERRRAEQALRDSEERFAKAFEANPMATVIVRAADGRIVAVNEACTRLFGYSRDQLLAESTLTLGLWVDVADRTRLLGLLRESGRVRDFAFRFRRTTGEVRQGVMQGAPIELAGEPCILLMCEDVTERRLMEERTLAAERLGALGQVAAGVAHEFNNVLAGIMGRLELLALDLSPEGGRQLQLIQQAVEDGAAMVSRIQTFARLRQPVTAVAVDVRDLVLDVIAITQPRVQAGPVAGAQIAVTSDVPAGVLVAGNPTELREVLTNLILNAVDAMPDGGRIAIGAAAHGDQVALTVRDTGSGMDAATQARIFEPFFTTKLSGSGLGLILVKNIVTNHHGEIAVVSAPGAGTTFTVTLPAAGPAPRLAPPPAPEPPRPPGARILAIDDDPDLADMLRAMLRMGGHEVVVVTSGPEGLAQLATQSFDLVCTDLGMPGMNGWEVVREVRRRAPGTPIALITGWGHQLDPAELAAHGVDFLLPKPYRIRQLHDLVAQALARRDEC
jgi:PAS domain S-box-containing protein